MKRWSVTVLKGLFFTAIFAAVFWVTLPKNRVCTTLFNQLERRFGVAVCGKIESTLYGCKIHNGTIEISGSPLARFSKITLSPLHVKVQKLVWLGETGRFLPSPVEQALFSPISGKIEAKGIWGRVVGSVDIRHKKIRWRFVPTRTGRVRYAPILRTMKKEKNGYVKTLSY